jgi:ADP-dependent NAD(P)H-hydrate dehydratase
MSRSLPADPVAAGEEHSLTPSLLRGWPLPLDPHDTKRERGTVLVVAGTTRTSGAGVLSGLAALRAGAGRLQIATVEPSAAAMSVAVPEALIESISATPDGSLDPAVAIERLAERARQADAVLIGPGFDDLGASARLLSGLLHEVGSGAVVVIDAVALRSVRSVDERLMRSLAGRAVFTPNPDEASALLPEAPAGAGAGDLAALAANMYGAVVTVHGHVAAPDGRRWVAADGVAGLGTSGSGDVLAGLVAGAAARSADAAQSACWGTYLHVAAGARLGTEIGGVGFLARELLDAAPRVLAELSSSR